MKNAKENMIFSQLRANDISEQKIIDAFSLIDREDFVPVSYKRVAYSDSDLILPKGRIMFRPEILGRICRYVLQNDRKNILIIGDTTGYTAAILGDFVQTCDIGAIFFDEIEGIRECLPDYNIKHYEFILQNVENKYDQIILDGGGYTQNFIMLLKKILTYNGEIIFFKKNQHAVLNINNIFKQDIAIMAQTIDNQETELFCEELKFPENYII